MLERLIDAWRADDLARVDAWSAWLAASPPDARDARGGSPAGRRAGARAGRRRPHRRRRLGGARRTSRTRRCSRSPTARYAIPTSAALAGYAFAWAEATTSAAVRLVPLGQSAGQRLLAAAGDEIPEVGRAGARPRRRRAGVDRARPGDRERAARDPVHPAVPLMTRACNPFASASPARSARARPRWSMRCASGCATSYDIAVVTNDIYTKEDAQFLMRSGALPEERIVGVETGGCPHTAIREDASINLDAVDGLSRKFPKLDLVIIESGGDNLAATFSPELADLCIYVIDVAGGDKIPRKGGPGITRVRSAGHQQDRPRPARRRVARGDGPRRPQAARRAPLRLHLHPQAAKASRPSRRSWSAKACSRRRPSRPKNGILAIDGGGQTRAARLANGPRDPDGAGDTWMFRRAQGVLDRAGACAETVRLVGDGRSTWLDPGRQGARRAGLQGRRRVPALRDGAPTVFSRQRLRRRSHGLPVRLQGHPGQRLACGRGDTEARRDLQPTGKQMCLQVRTPRHAHRLRQGMVLGRVVAHAV